jgi:CheY-like chemotaxis protein
MPVKDGFQAASEMRTIEAKKAGPKRAKIIAVTALSQEQSKRKGMLECGIGEFSFLAAEHPIDSRLTSLKMSGERNLCH